VTDTDPPGDNATTPANYPTPSDDSDFVARVAQFRATLADALDDRADLLRGDPLRSGAVGIEFIHGIEYAASTIRVGSLP
jgi:hypothetical protein